MGATQLIKKEFIIDAEGEVQSEKSTTYYPKLWSDKKEGGIIMPRNHHKKIYSNIKLSSVIKNNGDLLKTYMLTECIVKDTNRIGHCVGRRPRFADERDIAEMLGITEKKAREYINRMIKARVIGKQVTTTGDITLVCFIFNPIYVNAGKFVPLDIYVLFREDIDQHIPLWMKAKYAEAFRAKEKDENEITPITRRA